MTINWEFLVSEYNAKHNQDLDLKSIMESLTQKYNQVVAAKKIGVSKPAFIKKMKELGCISAVIRRNTADLIRDIGKEKVSLMTAEEVAIFIGEKNRNRVRSALRSIHYEYIRVKMKKKVTPESTKIFSKFTREYWGDDVKEKYCKCCKSVKDIQEFRGKGWQERHSVCMSCESRQDVIAERVSKKRIENNKILKIGG